MANKILVKIGGKDFLCIQDWFKPALCMCINELAQTNLPARSNLNPS